MPKTPEEIAEIEKHVQGLLQKYGSRRAILHRADKVAEDVWITFVDDLGMHRYASNTSYNELFTARLLNRPEAFAGKDWGDQVKLRTNYTNRPYAHEFENKPDPPAEPDYEWYGGY